MSSHNDSTADSQPLDLSKFSQLPTILIVVGAIGVVLGFFTDTAIIHGHAHTNFAFSWLIAFMFFLSLGLGGLGLVMLHHVFDASWSVPIRRISEHLSCLLQHMIWLWIPIGLLAPNLYDWIREVQNHDPDHSIKAKFPLFTLPGFYITSAICLLIWIWLPTRLRSLSLQQDETGSVECTRAMRKYSCGGLALFAITLTMGGIMWMKALSHEWFSTMYGVYYFAGSMWVTIATVYIIALLLKKQGPLRLFVHDKTFYFLGTLLFAFTVFYAYVTFSQYFIIWNANVPEETFWYVLREKGTWWYIGLILIFGHFFVPFLSLLRIDAKLNIGLMFSLFVWAWLMHFIDMSFNILPVLHPDNYYLDWRVLASMAFIGGVLSKIFLKQLHSHPIVPLKDPRFAESQDIYVKADQYVEAATDRGLHPKKGGVH